MKAQSTTNRSHKWRTWHATNYNIGTVFFLFGSILLFPYYSRAFYTSSALSAWLYTIGSLCFTLADFTQWSHYQPPIMCIESQGFCINTSKSVNFMLSFLGSVIYLIGSIAFMPSISATSFGLKCFIIGSLTVFVSQSWKIGVSQAIKSDISGFYVDLFAGLGAIMYFFGSFLFLNSDQISLFYGSLLFSTGGFLFYLSGMFMLKRYFISKQSQQKTMNSNYKPETQLQQISTA